MMVMKMDKGLDTGPVALTRKVEISDTMTAGELHDRMTQIGAKAMVEAMVRLEMNDLPLAPQPAEGAVYAAKIDKRETRLDWTQPAATLERAVRAFRPAPGAQTLLDEEPLKIWRAHVTAGSGEPGAVLNAGDEIVISCGEGALAVSELQRAGGRRLSARDFLRGYRLAAGARFP